MLTHIIRKLEEHRHPLCAPLYPDNGYTVYDAEDRALHKQGITVLDGCAPGNLIVLENGSERTRRLDVEFRYGDNVLVLGANDGLRGHVKFWGPGNLFVAGGMAPTEAPVILEARLASRDSAVLWGKAVSSNGVQLVTEGARHRVVVGDGSMLAMQIWIRNSDMHAMVDLRTGAIINSADDVLIGRRVWVGQEATILKGAIVGDGSIIGAKSLVGRGLYPATSLVAGNPATLIRSGVSWTRSSQPSVTEVDALRALYSRAEAET